MKYVIKRKDIGPGTMIPPFYGIAYVDYRTGNAICYPLFINLAIILWRDLLLWLKNPKGSP